MHVNGALQPPSVWPTCKADAWNLGFHTSQELDGLAESLVARVCKLLLRPTGNLLSPL